MRPYILAIVLAASALTVLMEAQQAALAFILAVSAQAQPQQPQRYRSKITVFDLAARRSTVLYTADQVIEAPNWSHDGNFLIVNTGGNLYRLPVSGEPKLDKIDLGAV